MTLSVERRCRWCGRGFARGDGAGRPRLYCKRSCRQRDYETRRRSHELGLGEHELIVTRQELDELKDRLYILSETVTEVELELADDAADNDRRLLRMLVDAAKHAGSGLCAPHSP